MLEEPEANDGGGILVQPGGSADIEKSHIVENQAGGSGGGIANFGKTSLRHTTVADNTAFFFGGGILNAGVLKVEESHVKYNKAGIGGGGIANGAPGIFRDDVDGGTVWIDKTDISNNHTIGFGGGLLDIEGNTTIKYSRILDNTALIAGGGIAAADDSQLHLHKVTIAKNTTVGVGGGLALAFGAHVTAEKTEVKENFAAFFGGGVFNLASEVTFRDSEIVGNQAVGPIGIGGGIFNVFGRVNLHDTKVADNVSRFRPGGVFNFGGEVNVDDKSAIKGNKPTNCLGSPSPWRTASADRPRLTGGLSGRSGHRTGTGPFRVAEGAGPRRGLLLHEDRHAAGRHGERAAGPVEGGRPQRLVRRGPQHRVQRHVRPAQPGQPLPRRLRRGVEDHRDRLPPPVEAPTVQRHGEHAGGLPAPESGKATRFCTCSAVVSPKTGEEARTLSSSA